MTRPVRTGVPARARVWRDRLGLLLGLAALPFLAGQVWSAMQAMPQAMSACVEVARG